MMPVMDGYGFLEARAKDPKLASVPVAVVTAGHGIDDARIGNAIPDHSQAVRSAAAPRRTGPTSGAGEKVLVSPRTSGDGVEQLFQAVVASVKDYAIFMLDRSGRVATWNAGAELIKGYRSEEVIGKEISIFYTPEDVAGGKPRALLAAALAHGRVEDEGWRVRKDGTRFWADVVITPIRDPAENLQGFVKVTRDLTDRKRAEDRLRRSEESLQATLYSIGDGVLATDEQARVTRVNPVAERLTGWPEAEAVGRPIGEIFRIINEETRAAAPIRSCACWRKESSWGWRTTRRSSPATGASARSRTVAPRSSTRRESRSGPSWSSATSPRRGGKRRPSARAKRS